MIILQVHRILLNCVIRYHGNHAISNNQNGFIFEERNFVHSSVHIESIRNASRGLMYV